MSGSWVPIIHGGAKEIEPEKEETNRAGCRPALSAGRSALETCGTAVEGVVVAVNLLEDDATFSAGKGGKPNLGRIVERDAGLMDGITLEIGAVTATTGVPYAIRVAVELRRELPIGLARDARRSFDSSGGLPIDARELRKASPTDARHDTVGCVALDQSGCLAAGTLTGGLKGMPIGSVGDLSLSDCGHYRDDLLGPASLSGDGGSIARLVLADRAVDNLGATDVAAACRHAIQRLSRIGGEAGVAAIDRNGAICWNHNSSHFAVALAFFREPEGIVHLGRHELRKAEA